MPTRRPDRPRRSAARVAAGPRIAGLLLLSLALALLAASFAFAQVADLLRLAAGGLGLVGLFAYGFGRLIAAANRSPREDEVG